MTGNNRAASLANWQRRKAKAKIDTKPKPRDTVKTPVIPRSHLLDDSEDSFHGADEFG